MEDSPELGYRLIIVCGLHRTGTTYVANILSQDRNVCIIHEPLNRDHGVIGVPVWYPYSDPDSSNSANHIEPLYRNISEFKQSWIKKPLRDANFVSWIRHKVFGDRQTFIWSQLKLRKYFNMLPDTVCWKDPFATFSVGYIVRSYGARALCMVRHPGAVYHSTIKRGWHFDIKILLSQEGLIRDYGTDIPAKYWDLARTKQTASIAILWKLMRTAKPHPINGFRLMAMWPVRAPGLRILRGSIGPTRTQS